MGRKNLQGSALMTSSVFSRACVIEATFAAISSIEADHQYEKKRCIEEVKQNR